MSTQIKSALQFLSIPEKAAHSFRFFKAGKGEYAEGDQFIGVTVPDQRIVAIEYFQKITLEDLGDLLSSKIHEHRHCALFMLVFKYEKSRSLESKWELVEFFLKNRKYVNNWDLVDTSCYKILGNYCYEIKDDSILIQLSEEENLWSQRIAVVSTMYHVKKGSFELLKSLALKNLHHEHDLMHKANGWLLREMGKKNETELLDFLNLHYQKMPRKTLRYAIEKLPESLRQDYLQSRI